MWEVLDKPCVAKLTQATEPHPVVICQWTPTATVSLDQGGGQMEVAAVPKHQWFPTILSSDVFAPLLSPSFFCFSELLKNMYLGGYNGQGLTDFSGIGKCIIENFAISDRNR